MRYNKSKHIKSRGRPKVTIDYIAILNKAIIAEAKHHKGMDIICHAIQQAYLDNSVLVAMVKKLLPDLKSVDMKLDGSSPFKLVIDMTPKSNNTKHNKSDEQYTEQ